MIVNVAGVTVTAVAPPGVVGTEVPGLSAAPLIVTLPPPKSVSMVHITLTFTPGYGDWYVM